MRRSRIPSIAVLGVLLAAVGAFVACQPPVGQPLTDPREILGRAVASTGSLRTATIRADVQMSTAPDPEAGIPGRVDGGSLEGAIDLATGAWSVSGAANNGSGRFATILVDKTIYTQSDPTGAQRWTAIPMDGNAGVGALVLGAPGMQTPDYSGILREAIAGPAIRAELAGVEDCPSGRCYRVGVEIPREETWPLVTKLMGFDQIPAMVQQAPPVEDLPAVSLAVLVDTASLYVVSLDLSGGARSGTFQARLELLEPNEPVSIVAPPEHLVDRMEGEILEGVGEPAQPAPMAPSPVEVPAPEPPSAP